MRLSAYSYTNQGGREHNEDSIRAVLDGGRGRLRPGRRPGRACLRRGCLRLAVDILCGEGLDTVPGQGPAAGAVSGRPTPASWSSRSSPGRRT